ncbi:hypothetical protein CK203_049361 [Vitis vinifera]|uniref:Uncharacterized protein n=1 Tax=Vitis vinifera TaxID=29760 RepID=A0A438FVH8_VITVI|nr:hypothetical protein CK203_049361 [Vitis vinifera]
MKGFPKLKLNSKGGYIETELGMEWPCSAIQISFNWQLCHHGAFDGYLMSDGDGVGSDSGSEDDSIRSIGSETFAFFFGDCELMGTKTLLLVFWPWRCRRKRPKVCAACSGGGGRREVARRFRSEGNFGIDFAAYLATVKRAYGATKWHSCAKGWFRSYETPFEMAYWLRNSGSQGMESSQPFRSCKMALVCQGASSQL